MSCCGKRRQEWMQENNASAADTDATPGVTKSIEETQGKIFKFTGTGSFSVTGAFTGYTYYFPFPGAQVHVDYHDAFALVAEPGLTLVPRSTQAS